MYDREAVKQKDLGLGDYIHFHREYAPKIEEAIKEHYGEKHDKYVDALKWLAYSYMDDGNKNQEAFDVNSKILQLIEEMHGDEGNEETAQILCKMAQLKSMMKEWDEWFPLIQKAKDISNPRLPGMKIILSFEAKFKEAQKKYKEERKD